MFLKNIGRALAFPCWVFLFTPALLEGLSPASVGLWLASACLFWCVSLWRPVLLVAFGVLLALGSINIMHAAFFGSLADQMFLVTVLRTNWQEAREFAGVLPWGWLALTVLWVAVAWLAARQVWRAAPDLSRPGFYRRMAWGALVIWLIFGTFVLLKGYSFDQVARKVKKIYPMHIVMAWAAQQQLKEAVFYQPTLPARAPADTAQVNTIVVVLGESASAQRWSLLGYEGADTNAPLRGIEGVAAVRAMSHGLNTAATVPYLLTGMDANESVQQRAPSFLDLAKSAGYKVSVFSNSRYFSSEEDFYSVVLRRSADVYQKVGNGAWDEVLTRHLEQALADPAPRKLVVLHTYGSHFQVQERYPASSALFADMYDNSMHYTSQLLADWIQLLNRSAGDARTAMLLYASDHGVAMPPCADQYRTGNGISSLQVPLLFWGNGLLKARDPELWPVFDERERSDVLRSNAAVAEMVAAAVGYPDTMQLAADSVAKQLTYQGKPWKVLKQLDACHLN